TMSWGAGPPRGRPLPPARAERMTPAAYEVSSGSSVRRLFDWSASTSLAWLACLVSWVSWVSWVSLVCVVIWFLLGSFVLSDRERGGAPPVRRTATGSDSCSVAGGQTDGRPRRSENGPARVASMRGYRTSRLTTWE